MEKNNEKFMPSKRDIFGGPQPVRLGVFAGSGSGKTTLLKNIMTDPEWGMTEKFDPDRVFIICPTVQFDDAYDDIIASLEDRSTEEHKFDKKKQVFETSLEQSLKTVYEHLFDEQKGKKELGLQKEPSLIILDDILLEIDLSGQHSQIARILTKCRHANINIILVSQHLMGLAPIGRNQLNRMVFFNQANSKETKKIREEISSGMKAKQFDELFNFCISEPYSYMLVCQDFPLKFRYFKGNGTDLAQLEV